MTKRKRVCKLEINRLFHTNKKSLAIFKWIKIIFNKFSTSSSSSSHLCDEERIVKRLAFYDVCPIILPSSPAHSPYQSHAQYETYTFSWHSFEPRASHFLLFTFDKSNSFITNSGIDIRDDVAGVGASSICNWDIITFQSIAFIAWVRISIFTVQIQRETESSLLILNRGKWASRAFEIFVPAFAAIAGPALMLLLMPLSFGCLLISEHVY